MADYACIPFDPDNTDFKRFKAWEDAGNTPSAYVPSKEEINAGILSKIDALERRQPRTVRESILGILGGTARLRAIEEEIVALRAQLQ